MESPQFAKLISMPQLYQHIMEGLLTHFFPDTDDSGEVYNKQDVQFFLSFANEQYKQKAHDQTFHQDDKLQNFIILSKFKFHLDKILHKGWSKNGVVAKPLTFYKLEVNNNSIIGI